MDKSRVSLLDSDEAHPDAGALFGEIEDAYGMILNMARALAHHGELDADVFSFMTDLEGRVLPDKHRELAYSYVSTINGCEY